MLSRIRRLYDKWIEVEDESVPSIERRLQVAAAALMLEVMRVDNQEHSEELDTILVALREKFNLGEAEARGLVENANGELDRSTDYHQFTSLMHRHLDREEKVRVLEYLWQIAYADNVLDKYEEHAIRKVADLLYLSHADFITAKQRVLQGRDLTP
jgi:uncharacterized tellurite resistance protein B-like protein